MIRLSPLYLFTLLLLSCQSGHKDSTPSNEQDQTQQKPNIIFLIGDGMGLTQVSTVYYYPDKSGTNFSKFNNIGLINTSAAEEKITDSAAGATAFSTGNRTYNGAINVGLDSTHFKHIVDILSEKSYQTGVIATSSVTHATPACYYAHSDSRNKPHEIAKQLADSEIDFFAGGGKEFFRSEISKLEEAGFTIDTNSLSLENPDSEEKYGFMLANDGMPKIADGRGDFLPNATQLALNYFSGSSDPFFLMVEGSQIDWGGHANDADYIIDEVHDFDKAIGVAMDFAEKNGNTIVVVTADHETGGMALSAQRRADHQGSNYAEVMSTFSTGGHTSTLIPVFAFGPGSDSFRGIYNNTEIFHKMLALVEN